MNEKYWALGLTGLAKKYNLYFRRDTAYGFFQSYAISMKQIPIDYIIRLSVIMSFCDKQKEELEKLISSMDRFDLAREYKVVKVEFYEKYISIVFRYGTHSYYDIWVKIQKFFKWFFPLLDEYGISKGDLCPECGKPIVSGQWVLIDNVAYYLHDSCAKSIKYRLLKENEAMRNKKAEGLYMDGIKGGIKGAILGAILWALTIGLGYFTAIAGIVIALLIEKFYNRANGRRNAGKFWIILFQSILSIMIGTIGGIALFPLWTFLGGNAGVFSNADYVSLLLCRLFDSQFLFQTICGGLAGIVLAAVITGVLMWNENKNYPIHKFVDLQEKRPK